MFTCLRESGVTAFFTRSSAANIPINLELCRRLGLHEDTYSISIPLGATINMAGAAITISVMTLAAAHTLGIPVDFATALLLCVVSSLAACRRLGRGRRLAAADPDGDRSLFGIPADVAMQVVAIGFVISVVQDSAETALNSSTDVLFTAAACAAESGEPLNLDRARSRPHAAMQHFASDNYAGVCPEALAAFVAANAGHAPAYGEDEWTRKVSDRLRELFETDCDVYFVFNGTAANSLALASLCQSYHSVVCHELAHVETDECGGPEFFSNGSKLLPAHRRHTAS